MAKDTLVLGVNFCGHDTSAALMVNSQLVAACEQERFTRDKHSRVFPIDAARECLALAGVSESEIAELAFGFDPFHHIQEVYLKPALSDPKKIKNIIDNGARIRERLDIESVLREHFPEIENISYRMHHECHLASTYFPSGFDRALVLSLDGIGEISSGLTAIGKKGKLEVFGPENRFPNSLGLLYSAVTHFLGWKHHCDEGIVMGLATFGDPAARVPGDGRSYIEVFRSIVGEKSPLEYEVNTDWIAYHRVRDKWVSEQFEQVFGRKRKPESPISDHHRHIAAALQMRLEEIVLKQLGFLRKETGMDKLCLSGGVALNCSMNGKIESARMFDEIFVQPASGDAGIAIGACYLAQIDRGIRFSSKRACTAYLGSEFEPCQIEAAFLERGLQAETPSNLQEQVAARLAAGKIVGWFQGRAEFGPRALGNRSILTRPYPASMKDFLNNRVKFREEFRPFAPAILEEYARDFFKIDQNSPHMLIAAQAKKLAQAKAPATVHVDNSSRVQTVRKADNREFYLLLEQFYEQTSCPILLNTSFNIKGQPIVNSPGEAIDCFLSTNLDCIAVGPYFFEK